jgi:hypothetical protein
MQVFVRKCEKKCDAVNEDEEVSHCQHKRPKISLCNGQKGTLLSLPLGIDKIGGSGGEGERIKKKKNGENR